MTVAITGWGVFTPSESISNAELVAAFNAYADRFNAEHADAIAAGEVEAKPHSNEEFIEKASGIRSRFVLDKKGVLDPEIMHPVLPKRGPDELSFMAEMAVDAARQALEKAGRTGGGCGWRDLRGVEPRAGLSGDRGGDTGSARHRGFRVRHERGLLVGDVRHTGRGRHDPFGFGAFDPDGEPGDLLGGTWNGAIGTVTSSSATSARRFCWNARTPPKVSISRWWGTRLKTAFSNNIRNDHGFLRRSTTDMEDRRDMQFMQEGRKVFREVVPMVSDMVLEHLADEGVDPGDLKRLWLHQANKGMNDFIARKVMGREPTPTEQPNILQDYANTSSAGSIITFAQHQDGMEDGDLAIICSFGAGYSVGNVIVRKRDG